MPVTERFLFSQQLSMVAIVLTEPSKVMVELIHSVEDPSYTHGMLYSLWSS